MKKTQKSTHTTKTTTKAKEAKPILSTGKKIGLTIYFTFIFTLMGVMGLQIWLNGPSSPLSNDSLSTPQQTTQQSVDNESNNYTMQNNSSYNDITTQYNTNTTDNLDNTNAGNQTDVYNPNYQTTSDYR